MRTLHAKFVTIIFCQNFIISFPTLLSIHVEGRKVLDLLAVFYGEIAVRGGTSPATAIVAPQFYGQIILPIDRQKWLFFHTGGQYTIIFLSSKIFA